MDSRLWIDLIGYFGAAATLWGMSNKTIIQLRLGAVLGNAGFIVFAVLAPSYPTLVLHALLLPINGYRLWQMVRLIKDFKDAEQGDDGLNGLLPTMALQTFAKGEVLFKKGEKPDRMIIIKTGTVHLQEINVDCHEGDVLGEMAVFTPNNKRTCTAVCETECQLYVLGTDRMLQLYYQNPKFGLYLMRTITARLLNNWQDAEQRAKIL